MHARAAPPTPDVLQDRQAMDLAMPHLATMHAQRIAAELRRLPARTSYDQAIAAAAAASPPDLDALGQLLKAQCREITMAKTNAGPLHRANLTKYADQCLDAYRLCDRAIAIASVSSTSSDTAPKCDNTCHD